MTVRQSGLGAVQARGRPRAALRASAQAKAALAHGALIWGSLCIGQIVGLHDEWSMIQNYRLDYRLVIGRD